MTDSRLSADADMSWPSLSDFLSVMHESDARLTLHGEEGGKQFWFGMLPAKPKTR